MSAFRIGVACMAAWLAASVVSAQSLADIARLEAERRKAIATPGKVFTNESLRPEPPPAAPVQAVPAATAPDATESPTAAVPSPSGVAPEGAPEEEPEPPRDEAYWRDRIAAERDGLARAQTFAEALQTRINALTNDFTARDDPAQRDVIAADRQKALAELGRVRQEIAAHEQAIAGIQEEARRAGVPAGWVR